MKSLLWKEMRELRTWVLIGLAMAGIGALLFQSQPFANRFLGGYASAFMPFVANVTAIGLAAAQVAKERQAKTLDYLLVRPAGASAIIWAKFIAGTGALALLLPAMVSLVFCRPAYGNTVLSSIREHSDFLSLTLTLFPRLWCLYAVTLFLSALSNRTAKVWAMVAALAVTAVTLGVAVLDRLPFTSLPVWFPFFEGSGGLLHAAGEPALFWVTGSVFTAIALLLAFGAAAVLRRSAGRYLGNRALACVAAAAIGGALLLAHSAPLALPSVAPAGILQLADGPVEVTDIAADDGRVVLASPERGLIFLDFSQPSKPAKAAEIAIPLFTPNRVYLAGTTAYSWGQRKALPADENQITVVSLESQDSARLIGSVSLGAPSSGDYFANLVVIGRFAYVAERHERQISVRAFDLSSNPIGRETAALAIERLPEQPPLEREGELRHGFQFRYTGTNLYVLSSAMLTVIDAGDPAHPRVAGRLEFHPPLPAASAYMPMLPWRNELLYQRSLWPPELGSFDISDSAHPVAKAAVRHLYDQVILSGSGPSLFQPWKNGLLEYQPVDARLQVLRYLSDDEDGSIYRYAQAGEYMYAWKRSRMSKQPGRAVAWNLSGYQHAAPRLTKR